jgi:hypothetical protein
MSKFGITPAGYTAIGLYLAAGLAAQFHLLIIACGLVAAGIFLSYQVAKKGIQP